MNEPRSSKVLILEHSSSEVRFRTLNHNQFSYNRRVLDQPKAAETWLDQEHLAVHYPKTHCPIHNTISNLIAATFHSTDINCIKIVRKNTYRYIISYFSLMEKQSDLIHVILDILSAPYLAELQLFLFVYASVFSPSSHLIHTPKMVEQHHRFPVQACILSKVHCCI